MRRAPRCGWRASTARSARSTSAGLSGTELRYPAAAVAIIAGLLMVSRVRYNSFKGSGQGARAERVPFTTIVIAVAALIALWIDPPRVLLAVTALYALSG